MIVVTLNFESHSSQTIQELNFQVCQTWNVVDKYIIRSSTGRTFADFHIKLKSNVVYNGATHFK